MRALISALAVASAFAFALPAFADDVKTDPAKSAAKPGRSIDEPVKSGPVDKPGRQADDSTVKSGKDMTKPGRAADDSTKPATKKSKKKKHKDAQ